VIGSTRQVAVYALAGPTDLRKQFDALAALVTHALGRDVLSGELFLFVSRDQRKARVLFFDGTGLCLFAKRLSRGRFTAPWLTGGAGPRVLTTSELALFLEGSALAGAVPLSPPPVARAPAVTPAMFAPRADS
jgi:transposase